MLANKAHTRCSPKAGCALHSAMAVGHTLRRLTVAGKPEACFSSLPCSRPDVERASIVIANAGKSSAGKSTAGKGFGAPKKVDATMDPTLPCPCGSSQTFEGCCQKYLTKTSKVTTPEQLLRSRYTAYTLKNADYIADTTHQTSTEWTGSRQSYLQSVRETMKRADWQGLKIEKQEPGADANEVSISFKAYYVDRLATGKDAGKRKERVEKSLFMKEGSTWFYMGGDLQEEGPPPTIESTFPAFQVPKLPLPKLPF